MFSHQSGLAKIDFKDLDEASRVRFGYDPARYDSFKEEQARSLTPPPPAAPQPESAPANAGPAPVPAQPRIVRKVVVITNSPPPVAPFGGSPASTIEPDYQKMNTYRRQIIEKQLEINNRTKPKTKNGN